MRTQLALILAIVSLTPLVQALDWPNWRGPNHNGISEETGWRSVWPAVGPTQLWKANVGTGFASFVVSNGRAYTVGNKDNVDTVYCFDAVTGEVRWRADYKQKLAAKYYEGGPSATPTVDGNRIFMFSKSGMVICLSDTDGKTVWQKYIAADLDLDEPSWGFAGSPLVQGDLLILNAGTSGVALNKHTGDILWTNGKVKAGYATPVPYTAGGQECVALMGSEALYGVAVADGDVLWSYPWETRHGVNAADPVVRNGERFFITSGYNHGCALLSVVNNRPLQLWQSRAMRSQITSPVLWKEQLYGIDDNKLVCLELRSGEQNWSERSIGTGSLMIADGKLIVLAEKGELYVAEATPAGFKVISRAQVLGGKCWTVPVLANGLIYCRNSKGDVVCLDVRGR